jgi:hypothetical protein
VTPDEKNNPMSDALKREFRQRRQRAVRGLGKTKTSHPAKQWLVGEIRRVQGR